jgi:hypothetical protein
MFGRVELRTTTNHYPEMTTMTDDGIVLRELLGEERRR